MKTPINIFYMLLFIVSTIATSAQNTSKEAALNPTFNAYFAVKEALVQTDAKTTATKAKDLLTAMNAVKMGALSTIAHKAWMKTMKDLKADTDKIASTNDIKKQRSAFTSLSTNMYTLMKTTESKTPVYYQYCPMANNGKGGTWLSTDKAIKNPYFGSQMLSCGSIKETL